MVQYLGSGMLEDVEIPEAVRLQAVGLVRVLGPLTQASIVAETAMLEHAENAMMPRARARRAGYGPKKPKKPRR